MRRALISALSAVLAGACSAPTDHFYTLIGEPQAAAPAGKGGPSVLIASVRLPEAVDRSELVVRKGPNSVAVMDTRRWAESLKSGVARAVADDLGPLLDGAPVSTADDNVGQNAKYQVRIDITRFDTVLGGTEAIDAVWVIHPASGAEVSGTATLRVPAQGAEIEQAVAAHSRALAQLSGDIAKQIKSLEKGGN